LTPGVSSHDVAAVEHVVVHVDPGSDRRSTVYEIAPAPPIDEADHESETVPAVTDAFGFPGAFSTPTLALAFPAPLEEK
jgi:hypothetical protein